MTWQDPTLTLAVILLSYAVIPQIIKAYKEKKSEVALQTSILTSLAAIAIGITYISLNLTFSAIMNFTAALLWIIVLIQTLIYKKSNKQ